MKIKKHVSMFVQNLLALFCVHVSNILLIQVSGCSWGGATNKNGAKSEWIYLGDWGPKMLIVRDGRVLYLMSAFATEIEFDSEDQTGHIISCKPLLLKLEKGDRVILGFNRVYREYSRLQLQ